MALSHHLVRLTLLDKNPQFQQMGDVFVIFSDNATSKIIQTSITSAGMFILTDYLSLSTLV